MKFQVKWDNPDKTIIHMAYMGKWTWQDFYNGNLEAVALAKSVVHRVDVIADFLQSQGLSFDYAIIHARNAMDAMSDNWGILIVLTNDPLIERLVNIFRITFRRLGPRTFLASSTEEAYRLIAKQGSSVP